MLSSLFSLFNLGQGDRETREKTTNIIHIQQKLEKNVLFICSGEKKILYMPSFSAQQVTSCGSVYVFLPGILRNKSKTMDDKLMKISHLR